MMTSGPIGIHCYGHVPGTSYSVLVAAEGQADEWMVLIATDEGSCGGSSQAG
jgi:hypothetical protein